MPLTLERDGLFRGRRSNHEAWYIVDPRQDGAAGVTVETWRRHYLPTNRPGWQRVLRGVVFVLTWGLVTIGAAAVVPLITVLSTVGQVAAVFGLSLAGLVLAGLMMVWVFPYREVEPLGNLSVVRIPSSVVEWANDDSPVDVLWNLVEACRDAEEVRSLIELISVDWWRESGVPRPDTAIEQLVEPILRDEWEKRRHRLLEMSEELGFVLPEDLLWDPPNMSSHRES